VMFISENYKTVKMAMMTVFVGEILWIISSIVTHSTSQHQCTSASQATHYTLLLSNGVTEGAFTLIDHKTSMAWAKPETETVLQHHKLVSVLMCLKSRRQSQSNDTLFQHTLSVSILI
jgi:hypothetical protein